MADWGSAAIGASVALITGFGLETLKRRRERSAIAGALAGEISALIHLADQANLSQAIDAMVETHKRKLPMGAGTGQRLENYTPVFDKNAEKIGQLPPAIAKDVAVFYNKLWAFRRSFSDIVTDAFKDDPNAWDKNMALMYFVRTLSRETFAEAKALVGRLEQFRDRPLWVAD